jgi:heptosyltransferase-2
MSLPALKSIRERFPNAGIAVLAKPWVADLYRREAVADEVILYRQDARWRMLRELRARRFDCAILLQNAFEAALIAFLAGIPNRIGYNRDGRGFLLTRAVAPPKPGEIPPHQRFYYLELLRRARIIDALPSDPVIRLNAPAIARNRIIGISPGAAFGGAKRWLPERFAEAAAQIADARGATIALFGSAGEREVCDRIARLLPGYEVTNHAGATTLAQFIDLAAACEIFLTNDSGAMHIASALGVPTVAVFGATDPLATGPAGPRAIVIREPVECSPCLLRECPIDHRCMTRVDAARVVQQALALVRTLPESRAKILGFEEVLRRTAGRPVKWVAARFDPLLAAHARRLAQIKTPGDALAVIVQDSPAPLLPQQARAELAAALGVVDYVVLGPAPQPAEDLNDGAWTARLAERASHR